MSLGFTDEIPPVSGTTYERLPDGFEATASTRAIGRSIIMIIWLAGFAGFFTFGMITDPKSVPTVARVAVVIALALVIPQLAMSIAGRVRVRLQGGTLRLSNGIGGLGWSRNLDWSTVRNVEEIRVPGRAVRHRILIQGAKDVKFGQLLNQARRGFLVQVLQRELAKR